jgi:hypothetical protein
MNPKAQQPSNYRVEVSGWDALESFFLEKTVLYSDSAGPQICLRARLREGSVVFVRPVQPFASDDDFPVPYVAIKNLPLEMDGRVSISIARLHPQPSFRQTVSIINSPRLHVALFSRQFQFETALPSPGPF